MQPEIEQNTFQHLHPLRPVETEQVEIRKVHPHQLHEEQSFVALQHIRVRRMPTGENTAQHIEAVAPFVTLRIREEAQITRQLQQETDMEIGFALLHHIQQFDRLQQIGKQRRVGIGLANHLRQHFGKKQGNHVLHRIQIDPLRRHQHTSLLDLLYIPPRTVLHIQRQNRKRLKQHPHLPGLPPRAHRQSIRHTAIPLGIDMHDRHLVVVRDRLQYDSGSLFKHRALLSFSRKPSALLP